jgi:REP element-mobilizing transposase RayT
VGRNPIFFDPDNYLHCLRLVKRYTERYHITVIAYCLMPNHYHFLLRQDGEVSISKFINVLFNAYVQAVNRQQDRKGPLFEGRFRHVWVDREEYLTHLCRYIHLNPVAANLVSGPAAWPYSNYREWIGTRSGTLIDETFVKTYFETGEDYGRFVREGIDREGAAPAGIETYLF